ncbi:hypothetical protein HEB94_005895 [Actinopolymorpha pittospori]|uniref:30S ribosomal protein S14 n=1 Tax=Actinopolymorpha pittospori TaxID=648752 RepID=A0A927RAJ0_9ACTN|nr:hypothetical protein [Actinopolymorpha pittospori]
MAKKSKILANERRKQTVARYASRRAALTYGPWPTAENFPGSPRRPGDQ